MAERPLIERLRQQYFDNLSKRWNTDGTRKERSRRSDASMLRQMQQQIDLASQPRINKGWRDDNDYLSPSKDFCDQ